uniref:Uncharacterized protein n=1 Tax=Anguilla anguilla TaxID=7936 RepID=A0A0E9QCV5_ANGAN
MNVYAPYTFGLTETSVTGNREHTETSRNVYHTKKKLLTPHDEAAETCRNVHFLFAQKNHTFQ